MAGKRRHPQSTIPVPTEDVASLRTSVMAIKELVEQLSGQRGDALNVAVTWDDLVRLNIVLPGRVPKDIGSNSLQQQG